jgi:DNA repair exonuclease SbcCD ATPase subunit
MEQELEQELCDVAFLLQRVLSNQALQFQLLEKIMSTGQTGLAALQTFVTSFGAFETQLQTDITTLSTNNAALTAAIQAAIADLGGSEDTAVQSLVSTLQTALTAAQSQDATLESVNTNLATLSSSLSAAAPAPAAAQQSAGGTAAAQQSKANPASKAPAKS